MFAKGKTNMYNVKEFENRLTLLLNHYGFDMNPKEIENKPELLIKSKSLAIDQSHEITYRYYDDLSLESIVITVRQKDHFYINHHKNTVLTKDDAINQISKMLQCVLIALGEKLNLNDLLSIQLSVVNSEKKAFEHCQISNVMHFWDIRPEIRDAVNFHSEINVKVKEEPYVMAFTQFETNLIHESNNLGLSIKRQKESRFSGLFGKKQDNGKDTIYFTSPNNSVFYCVVIDNIIKTIELNFDCHRMNQVAIKEYCRMMGTIYYACGLAIERNHAKIESDSFYNLRNVHLQHFYGNTTFWPHSSKVTINMGII